MKTNKKGQIRLQKGDYRVGNFIFHHENDYIKVMAISSIVSWRVSLNLAIGTLVSQAIKEKHDNWLSAYAAGTFQQLCIVPDQEFFVKHAELVNAQVDAHPEYYGKERPTDDKEMDDKILREEEELQEELERHSE
jgi:hypothetical protein